MASRVDTTVDRVQSTAIEGRMRDLRHRQKQLLSLHQQLTGNEAEILKVLCIDHHVTADEASFILGSTLSEIRVHYDALDLKKELRDEYGIKWARSNQDKRTAQPLAYIVPDHFVLLYSALSAFAAATEAGTCCVFKIENSPSLTLPLLGQIFGQLHDKEAVCITGVEPNLEFLRQCLIVDQLGNRDIVTRTSHPERSLHSSPESLNIGVVDRTANIKQAAEALVCSRLAFGAASRQAVDQVFVNEFVLEEFLGAVKGSIEAWADQKGGEVENKRPPEDLTKLTSRGYEDVLEKSSSVCSVLKAGQTRVDRHQDKFLASKIRSGVLVIDVVTSLDDVIDTLLTGDGELGALYIFAGLKEAKYISQHIPTRVSFVNHINRRFQIGPAPPVSHAASSTVRYTRQMFENNSPQYVLKDKGRAMEEVDKLLEEARRPLKPTGQAKAGATGFFDVGVMLGAVVYLLPVAVVGLVGIGFGLQKVFMSGARGLSVL